jgi:hypothetical protein
MYGARSTALLIEIPACVKEEERLAIILDFEKARMHLIAEFTLKLAHWQEPPHVIYGIAHYDPDTAWRCFGKLEDKEHLHAKTKLLFSDELGDGVLSFAETMGQWPDLVDGDNIEFPEFRQLVCELRMSFSAERPVESEHAKTKRDVDRCPSHTDAFVSLAHRMGALTDYLTGSDQIFEEYARLVAQVTSGKRSCELLGLANHPSSLEKAKQGQDKQHWRVVSLRHVDQVFNASPAHRNQQARHAAFARRDWTRP